jgi:hypothetical protein
MNDLDNNIVSMESEDKKVVNYLPIHMMPAVSEYYQINCNSPLIYCEDYVCSVYKASIWYMN